MSKDKKKTNEESKKEMEKMLQESIEYTEELGKHYLELTRESRRRIDFVGGVALGLLCGILGNLVIQHWYPVFEGLVLVNSDKVFWSNLIVFVPGFVIILYVINAFNRQLKEDERKMTMSRENVETAKKAIEVRKQRLEELKKQ